MLYYLGVTDTNWYFNLSTITPEDINFWQPGGTSAFKILDRGAPFLFKLKAPYNAIGGVGFFVSHTFLPLSIAWDTFGDKNGCRNFSEFRDSIMKYRSGKKPAEIDPVIGCIVLTDPLFFKETDWIPVPDNWSRSIVQGKSYSTDEPIGKELWRQVEVRLAEYSPGRPAAKNGELLIDDAEDKSKYGSSYLTKVRLGQGAFRVLVTDAYSRQCSISGERTLPVLEAAHIKPYAESGPHNIANGMLLRSDLHKLFDSGYLIVTEDYSIEISSRIKEEFENGRDYYKYHGNKLVVLPEKKIEKPGRGYLNWHNENVYRG